MRIEIKQDFCQLCLVVDKDSGRAIGGKHCKDFPGGMIKFNCGQPGEPIQVKGVYVKDCGEFQQAIKNGISVEKV